MVKNFFTIAVAFILLASTASYAKPTNHDLIDSSSQKILDVSTHLNGLPAGKYLEFYEDISRQLTIKDILKADSNIIFKQSDIDYLNFGLSPTDIWLKLTVSNTSQKPVTWNMKFLWQMLDYIDIYSERDDGELLVKKNGFMRKFSERDVNFHFFVSSFTEKPESLRSYYIHIKTDSGSVIPIQIWSSKLFEKSSLLEYGLFGIFFGFIILMIFYQTFLYFAVKDSSYLDYATYLSFFFVVIMFESGFAFQYLMPNNPEWGGIRGFAFFMSLSAGTYYKFARSFLNTKENAPLFDAVMKYGFYLFLLIAPFMAVISHQHIIQMFMFVQVAGLISLAAGTIVLYRGYKPARFYVAATSVFVASLMMHGAMMVGMLPVSLWTLLSFKIGAVIEILLYALALVDRLMLLTAEKEEAQLQVKEVLLKSTEELEEKVAKRTKELAIAKESAESATKFKDKFLSLISHDIRSPLISIKGNLEALPQGKSSVINEKGSQLLKRSVSSISSLLKFVEKVLDVSRLQTGHIKPNSRFFSCSKVVEVQVEAVSFLAREKEITIENRLPDDSKVFADPELIGQVILNLLSNALKFTPRGGRIKLYMPEQNSPTLAISDNGIGMKEEFSESIFNQHERTTTLGTEGEIGTGLGLPHSHQIMEAHGGSISVKSDVNKGSTFLIALPDAEAVVLIIDDIDAHREILKKIVSKIVNASFIEAENCSEAFEKLGNAEPTLVLCDIQMEGDDGWSFLESVQKNRAYDSISIVMVSSDFDGGDEESMRDKATEAGANDFLAKPFDEMSVQKRLSRFFG